MTSPPSSHDSTLSERLYRLLLRAYPRAFREEYASEMLLVFRDAYRETVYWQGTPGILRLWRDFFFDFVKTACIEHGRSWIQSGGRKFALAGKEQLAMTLQFTLDIAQRTDIGRTRANNEDNLISIVPEDTHLLQTKGALFVVSDGMGGHTRGEVASELAVEKVKEYYYQDLQHDIPTALQEAIKRANAAISQANEAEKAQGGSGSGMGATCVAAVLHDQMLYAANVGDSRVYVLHEGQLHQVTRDHSLVAQLVESGEITPAEARTHEKRNQIYRALGLPDVEVDLFTEPVQEGDTLILCTDGLCSVVDDDELRAIVEQCGPEESVERLIARANEAGGPDNVTAIVVRVSAA
ncbi:MAG TPA: Stp1/IreP family PP2C-type Ser/Thr phosphatase [Ktedonobacteraceae bacterium]|nr:Stp1/IreP family PP2C-type Ser/Thr phosphatase [Ktedonobacteraceae bacterium]